MFVGCSNSQSTPTVIVALAERSGPGKNQTVGGCARNDRIIADGGGRDIQAAGDSATYLLFKRLLDLGIVVIFGKGEDREELEAGFSDMQDKLTVAGKRLDQCSGDAKLDGHAQQRAVDVRGDDEVAALYYRLNIRGGQVVTDGHGADATAEGGERGRGDLDIGRDGLCVAGLSGDHRCMKRAW